MMRKARIKQIQRKHLELEAGLQKIRERYPSKKAIIEGLTEINVDITTYQFLGELFFQFLRQEYENGSMPKHELNKFLMIRFEILEMYELALAAKLIRP
jgi:hypothetical protein